MSDTPREIYLEAIDKILGEYAIDVVKMHQDLSDDELRQWLVDYTDTVRQTKEARIARKALKDASYARMFGN